MTTITTPDLPFRIGQGYDCHALVENRDLIIGGVEDPPSPGLARPFRRRRAAARDHDAILGAAALGDIGRHFPDTDAQFKGADLRAPCCAKPCVACKRPVISGVHH